MGGGGRGTIEVGNFGREFAGLFPRPYGGDMPAPVASAALPICVVERRDLQHRDLRNAMNPDATATLAPLSELRPARKVRRAVTTAVLGQILEWYDFFLYGTPAPLVFGHLFFPIGTHPLTGP